MRGYRWIMYLHTPKPEGVSVHLRRVHALTDVKYILREFERQNGFDDCSASLYPYSEENWSEAEKYEEIGNPFDYPSKVVERGPRGGVVITNA